VFQSEWRHDRSLTHEERDPRLFHARVQRWHGVTRLLIHWRLVERRTTDPSRRHWRCRVTRQWRHLPSSTDDNVTFTSSSSIIHTTIPLQLPLPRPRPRPPPSCGCEWYKPDVCPSSHPMTSSSPTNSLAKWSKLLPPLQIFAPKGLFCALFTASRWVCKPAYLVPVPSRENWKRCGIWRKMGG